MRQEIGLFIVERRCFFEVQNRQYANGQEKQTPKNQRDNSAVALICFKRSFSPRHFRKNVSRQILNSCGTSIFTQCPAPLKIVLSQFSYSAHSFTISISAGISCSPQPTDNSYRRCFLGYLFTSFCSPDRYLNELFLNRMLRL